jgi:hypothetical protein
MSVANGNPLGCSLLLPIDRVNCVQTLAGVMGAGGVNSVYLVYFARVIFSGGAVQYQQLAPSNQWPGFFDFYYCMVRVLMVATTVRGSGHSRGMSLVTTHARAGVGANGILECKCLSKYARVSTEVCTRRMPLSFTPLLRLKLEHACGQ